MTAVFITDESTLFLAKNKNEDSDLGWTVDLKINYRGPVDDFFLMARSVTELWTSEVRKA